MIATFPNMGYSSYAFESFLENLGCQVLIAPSISKRTIELGVRYSPEDACFPFKITLGNSIEALRMGADTLFMAAGARRCRFGFYHILQERILRDMGFKFKLYPIDQYNGFQFIAQFIPQTFGVSLTQSLHAVSLLFKKARLIEKFENLLRIARASDFHYVQKKEGVALKIVREARTGREIQKAESRLKELFRIEKNHSLKVGMVGEIFFMLDPFANNEIEKELGRMGVRVISYRSLYSYLEGLLKMDFKVMRFKRLAKQYLGESPGGEAEKSIGETINFAKRDVDGIVHVFPFGCMPENIASDIFDKISKDYNIPILSLSMDEHTSRTGLFTRLEAFIDLIKRRDGKFLRD